MMTRGKRVCAFIERHCKVPEGKLIGKPMKLDSFQVKFICDIYDNPHGTSRAYLSIARKNGKTGLIAGILLAHIAGPEAVQNTQIVSGALSREQAALVFALAVKMINLSPSLQKLTRIVPSVKRIIGLARNVEFRALSAEGKTAHGLSPVLAILDEIGQVRGPRSDFVDAITTSQGAHEQPLLIAISTQAPNDGDMFSIWIDDAVSSNDPHTVCHVYAAEVGCALDDEDAWRTANPALGIFRSLEDVIDQSGRAQRMPSFEPTFRNLVLNQRVEMHAPFISRGVWLLNSMEVSPEPFEVAPVYAGLDLSAKNDLTALVMIAYDEEDAKWHSHSVFWSPEKTLQDRSKRDRAPYDIWANQGLLRAVPGSSMDYEYLAREIAELLEGKNVQAVAFDRWRIDLLKKEFDEIGVTLPLVEFGQGFKDMAPALDTVETMLLNERVAHGAHPVLTMCAANARVETDAAGNRKLTKNKSSGRIDGLVAMAMAFGVMAMAENRSTDVGMEVW